MPDETAKLADAVSQAATGDAPAAVQVSRPSSAAVWCQVGALLAACIFAGVIIGVMAIGPWPNTEAATLRRLWFLGWMGLACIACIALSGLSQFWNRVNASAGPGHLELGNGR